MDFDYTTETITPDSTNILTIGGSGGLELPFGNTAARPGSPANGLIRYNTDTGQLEGFFSNTWTVATTTANQVTVQKNPGAGQFGSIAAAVASITTASASELWQVFVSPGIYTEPEIIIPPYVFVSGIGEYEIMVEPDAADHHVFSMSENTAISFLQVRNAGPGFAGINCVDVGSYALCHKVSMTNCDIGWIVDASTVDSIVYLEYCDTAGGSDGLKVSSSGGFSAYVNLENWYVYADLVTGINPDHGLFITGDDTAVNIQAFGLEGTDGTGHGFHIQDGATISLKAGHIYGWDIGVHIPNIGSTASNIQVLGCEIVDNTTWDLLTEQPLATGVLAGTARREYVNADISLNFTLAFSDPYDDAYVQTGSFYLGEDPASVTDVTSLIQEASPTGRLSGGEVTRITGLDVSVSAGYGYVNDPVTLKMKKIEWPTTTLSLPDDTYAVYIYISNSGVPTFTTSQPNLTQTIFLAQAATDSGIIVFLTLIPITANNSATYLDNFLRVALGPIFGTGAIVSENASTARSLDVTSGLYYLSKQEIIVVGGTNIPFAEAYHVGGVFIGASPSTSIVSNTQYDDGTDLVNLTTDYYTKHTLYVGGQGTGQSYILVYGQAEYANLLDAQNAPLPLPPPFFAIDTVPIVAIITQQGETNIVQSFDIRPRIGFTAPAISSTGVNHGDLLGLANDDHPQYLLVSGSRAMSGNLNLNTNNITNVGTVNSVTVQTHGSRHGANSADPVPTAAPSISLSLSSTNAVGIADTLSRSDHSHAITGVQPLDATLTAFAAYNTNGILTQTAADTFTGRTITGTASRVLITNGNGVAGNPTVDIDAAYAGQTSITTLGTVTAGIWNGTPIAATNGGTDQTVYAVGDILYANTTTTLSRLADIATGNALISGGTNIAPLWGKIGLTTHVSGTLPIANGGTNSSTALSGSSIMISNGTSIIQGPAGTTTTVLHGNASGTPTYGAVNLTADVSGTLGLGNGGTGQTTAPAAFDALAPTTTQGDIVYRNATTNTRLAAGTATQVLHGGTTPSWSSISLTTDVSGTLAIGNGGTGVATTPTNGQLLIGNGTNYTLAALTAGTNVSITNGSGSITINASAGGSPGGVNTNVQYNNAGAFGGNSAFNFTAGANPHVEIIGTTATNQLRVGGATDVGIATVYIETNNANTEGQRVYFNSGAPTTSGWMAYAYDGSTPYLSITDADDDPTYVAFNTIGTGTYAAPLYVSAFGARGAYGSRLAGADSGFAWYVGANTSATTLISAADPVMELDTQFLRIPVGTTANRPSTPTAGMSRLNSTTSRMEYYTGTAWVPSGSIIQTVTGNITKTSSNSQIPFDTTVPTSAEGVQLWSQSFTPLLANSTIIITTNSFFVINSANDIMVSGATFSGTTNIHAQGLGFGTFIGSGNSFTTVAQATSGSTTARTYSFRAGPNAAVTVFYGQGITATFGAAVTGTFIIQEIIA